MSTLDSLLSILITEAGEENAFHGQSLQLPIGRVYGGQVLAQALHAAARTTPEDRLAHSMHAYFLRLGNPKKPIRFEVDPIRNGGSFSTRRVVAYQQEKAIFSCGISFQTQEQGYEHQIDLDSDVPRPEELENDTQRYRRLKAEHPEADIPGGFFPEDLIDIRTRFPRNPIEPRIMPPVNGYWFRFKGELGDDFATHQALLCFISDWDLLGATLRPNLAQVNYRKLQMASLDHALWFHRDFRVDEWVYYDINSPRSAGGRGFSQGSFYNLAGERIATAAQEGLIRQR